jgi:hypothetical protein
MDGKKACSYIIGTSGQEALQTMGVTTAIGGTTYAFTYGC